MKRLLSTAVLSVCLLGPLPALAGSISTTTDTATITGNTVSTTNSGDVTATGNFNGRSIIYRGVANSIGVGASGASALLSIAREGDAALLPSTDVISNNTITAQNSGSITATGTFESTRIIRSNSSSMSVSAAGSSVTISIVKR